MNNRGIIYISRIPPYMKPTKVRALACFRSEIRCPRPGWCSRLQPQHADTPLGLPQAGPSARHGCIHKSRVHQCIATENGYPTRSRCGLRCQSSAGWSESSSPPKTVRCPLLSDPCFQISFLPAQPGCSACQPPAAAAYAVPPVRKRCGSGACPCLRCLLRACVSTMMPRFYFAPPILPAASVPRPGDTTRTNYSIAECRHAHKHTHTSAHAATSATQLLSLPASCSAPAAATAASTGAAASAPLLIACRAASRRQKRKKHKGNSKQNYSAIAANGGQFLCHSNRFSAASHIKGVSLSCVRRGALASPQKPRAACAGRSRRLGRVRRGQGGRAGGDGAERQDHRWEEGALLRCCAAALLRLCPSLCLSSPACSSPPCCGTLPGISQTMIH